MMKLRCQEVAIVLHTLIIDKRESLKLEPRSLKQNAFIHHCSLGPLLNGAGGPII